MAFGFFSCALASAVAKVDFEHFYVSLIFQEFRFPFLFLAAALATFDSGPDPSALSDAACSFVVTH